LPKGRLTVGNNIHTTGPEGFFHGMVDNVELFTYRLPADRLSLRLTEAGVEVVSQGLPGISRTLWRTTDLAGREWTRITSATADANGEAVLVDPAPPAGGAFYRTSTP
ncbi:MAG: hypothetical protein D6766_12865, partial [Verrucomicrobia bacterium]